VKTGRAWGLILALSLSWLAPATARAQLSGGVGAASDYRLRGVSLTDGRGVLSLAATYDHPSGLYAGASVVGHDPAERGPRLLGYQAYAGVAGRFRGGAGWDVGISRVEVRPYFDREYSIDYTEAYVGLSQGGLSGRVALAPDYPRRGATGYAELNAVARPADRWRLTGHAGARMRLGDAGRDGRTYYDVAVGVVREFGRAEASLSWVAITPRPDPHMSWTRPGLVAGLSVFF
jgi:uncharacterized protein (TIGR02001 family)